MRPLMIVLVVMALGIAGATAFLARNLVNRPAPAPVAEQRPPEAPQRVLVAARDIAAGSILVDEDLRYEQWPATSIDKRFIVHVAGAEDPKAQVVGSVAARHIVSGEPLSGTAVFRPDEAGHLSAMLGPGMRALSIAVTNDTSVSGFVTPGDRVDVVGLMAFKDASKGEDRAEDELLVTETVLRDARVLAVDQSLKTGQVTVVGRTVTLEVTPQDAEKLIIAGKAATLSVVLRSQTTAATLERDKLLHSVEALKMVRRYSDIAAKVGLGGEDADEPAAAKVRAVKVNRSGLIEVRNFPD